MKRPYIVAEMSGSHLGSLDRALKIIEEAKWAGADAIKLQTYDPNEMIGDWSYVLKGSAWDGENLLELYKRSHTPRKWHKRLFDYAKEIGIDCFSTPFSVSDVQFLETLDCPMYKVASLEITNLDLIGEIATTRKDIIISTGGATTEEIETALGAANRRVLGCRLFTLITLMKCTAAYPAEERNLVTITDMVRTFNLPVGLSDHSIGTDDAIIATSLGVSIIEKHITLDDLKGPDSGFALDPVEFKLMVNKIRYTAKALGKVKYGPTSEEMVHLRRSLYFAKDMSKGDYLCPHHITAARPALGLPLSNMERLKEGVHQVTQDVKAGQPITENVIESAVKE